MVCGRKTNHPSWREPFTIYLLGSLPFKCADCGVAGRTHCVPSVALYSDALGQVSFYSVSN